MKKIIIFLLAIIIVLSVFVSCDDGGKDNKPNSETQSADTNNKENKPSSSDDDKIDEESLRKRPENAASDFSYRNYIGDYGEGVEITGYVGTSNIVVIPKQIDGKNVIRINGYVFANKSTVKAVYIPETVKDLDAVFVNNKFVELVICEGVEHVGDVAFGNCSKLRQIVFGDKLMYLGDFSISSCPELTDVNIPSSLTEISDGIAMTIFHNCPKVTVYGESGSYIETFAQEHGIKFQAK